MALGTPEGIETPETLRKAGTDSFERPSNFDRSRANYNAPAGGTLVGFVIEEDWSGGTLPAGVTKLNNAYGVAGNNQNTCSPRAGFAFMM